MGNGIAAIHLRKSHGILVVQAMGQTGRGQRFLKQAVELQAKDPKDPQFKTQLAAAVETLDPSPAPSP
jgi:hypothetical protein